MTQHMSDLQLEVLDAYGNLATDVHQMNGCIEELNGLIISLNDRMRGLEKKIGLLYTPFMSGIFEYKKQQVLCCARNIFLMYNRLRPLMRRHFDENRLFYPQLMNQFHIYEEVGRGRHSTVYKSRRKKTLNYVAVKSVDKSQKARILNEVQIMFNMSHRNVLKFVNWYETRNHIWLIVEYCTGGNLRQILEQDKRLPVESIRLFANDLADGLHYIFSQGVVLCDLKTDTLLVDGIGRLKISDFGMAKRVGGKEPAQTRGTPEYMAPELLSDPPSPHTTESDMWALGCILYEMATGHTPFASKDYETMAQSIVSDDPVYDNAPFSRELVHLLNGLLEKRPEKRLKMSSLLQTAFITGTLLSVEVKEDKPDTDVDREGRIQAVKAVARRVLAETQRPSSAALYQKNRTGEDVGPMDDGTEDEMEGDEEIIADDDSDEEEIVEKKRPDTHLPLKNLVQVDRLDAASPRIALEEQIIDRPESAPPTARWNRPQSARGTQPTALATPRKRGAVTDRPTSAPMGGRRKEDADRSHSLINASCMSQEVLDSALANIAHSSDNFVRPVAGNKHIERLQPPKCDLRSLPFDVPKNVDDIESNDLEDFVTKLYRALHTSNKSAETHNIIAYCVRLCDSPSICNTMVNSTLMQLLVKMLKKDHSTGTRARLCHLLGMLFRHATFVGDELYDTGVIQALADVLRERGERLRRRAIAALGELLFYIATQQESTEPGKKNADWASVTPTIARHLFRVLKKDEDPTVQHYAVQALYNISVYSKRWGTEITTLDTMLSLWNVHGSSTGEWLRLTCSATISRLAAISPTLVPLFIERIGTRSFMTGLSDEKSALVQQMSVTTLISALTIEAPGRFFNGLLDVSRTLAPILIAMFDHSAPALRGKALLAMAVLCVRHVGWLSVFCRAKLAARLDRVVRDKDDYVKKCYGIMMTALSVVAPAVMQAVATELNRAAARAHAPQSFIRVIKEYLSYIPGVMDLTSSHSIRPKVINSDFVDGLGKCLVHCENSSLVSPEYNRTLLLMAEALTQRTGLLRSHSQAVLDTLLPALTSLIGSESGDTRVWCLKMASDCFVALLEDKDVYSSTAKSSESAFAVTRRMNEIILTKLLPHYTTLLDDRDPIPLYALKLLSIIFDRNPSFVVIAYRLKLIPIVFKIFDVPENSGRPSRYSIELVKQVIGSPDIEAQYCFDLDLVKKVNNVLLYAVNGHDDESIEPLLDIAAALLGLSATQVGRG